MWNVLFSCSFLSLQMFPCLLCLPAGERKQLAAWHTQLQGPASSSPHFSLKKMGRRDSQTDGYRAKSVVGPNSNADVRKRLGCGVPDSGTIAPRPLPSYYLMEGGLNQKQRSRRFALFGGRWEKTDLTYKIMRFPWQMSKEKVRRVLQEALSLWSAVTPLRFREVSTNEPANIIIDFNRYWHGDNLPFDGPGGILAHAFFPRTHREGEVHFDYDEHWTVGNNVGTDLLQVAAHEFGHVLGLQHSLEPGAIMSPFYSDSYPLRLSEDDTRGIQYLYGGPVHAPPEITNEIDADLPDACRTNFNAVSMIRGELFFFKSRYVWRIRDRQLQPGYPALASRHWTGIPNYIDAAYEDTSGNIWLFQGGEYWVFDAERRITGPAALWALGLPVTHIQAALKWRESDDSDKVYLLKSSFYWPFDPQKNQVEDIHPRSTATWEGLPSHIDAAFRDTDGYAVILSGLHYWKFDPVELTVLAGYPRSIGQDFFGCAAHPAVHLSTI